MSDLKNNLEQAWKEEARKAYRDQQSQDNEGGCREPIGFVQGYLAAKKSGFEEIKPLKEQLNDVTQLLRRIKSACSPSDIITCEQELEKFLKKQDKENKDKK